MEENKENEEIKIIENEEKKQTEKQNEENLVEKNDQQKEEKIEIEGEEIKTEKDEINNEEKKEGNKEEIKTEINNANNEEKINNETMQTNNTEEEKKETNENNNKEDNTKKEENLKIENSNNSTKSQTTTESESESLKEAVTMKIVENEISISKEYVLPKDFLEDKNRCNLLTQKLVNKTKKNANMKLDEFFTKKRHYLIMTDGGKPVYSRYGDEVENNSIFATISAMITKFTIFNNTDNFKEEINIISNNKNKIVFMKKGQLIFIALSKKVNDSVSLLHSQLEFIYNQLMSILTVRFYEKLEDNPSKCLTAMGGTENLFEQIIQYSSNSFISLFNSYQILNFINFDENRDKINKILEENKGNSLYCILMTPYEIISFAHSNQIVVKSSDLILIQNLIFCTEMLRTQESYIPICLPGISDQGFLQLYCHFSEENIGIIFVTENMDSMCFMEFQKRYNDIYDKIKNAYSQKIVECMRKNNNIKGKYSLFKKIKEKKQEFSDEKIVNKLINIIKQKKGITIEDEITPKRHDSSKKKELPKTKTYMGNFNTQNNLEKVSTVVGLLDKIKYGVIMNKKYNQYIMINFGMDYRNYDKKEKEIIHKYSQIYDIYNNYKEKEKEKDDFYYIEKTEKYYNIIYINEYFIIICSFNFFSNVEDIHKKCKEILKYFKKHENRYFIIYK